MKLNYGLDFLGIAKYGSVAVEELPGTFAVGCFLNTFGDPYPVLRKLAEQKGSHELVVRGHAVWADDHKYDKSKHDAVIEKEFVKFVEFVTSHKNVKGYFSPFCEHNIGESDLRVIFQKLSDRAKVVGISLVNSPLKGSFLEGDYGYGGVNCIETHGSQKRRGTRSIYSFDGTSCVDTDCEKRKREYDGNELFFFWDWNFNGKIESKDKTERSRRKRFPTRELVESIVSLSFDKGDTKLPKNWIWKTHSEDKSKPTDRVSPSRANKPVLISTVKASEVVLRIPGTSTVVGRAKYYGTFEGGRHRYYFSDYGYRLADRALTMSGGVIQLVEVVFNGKVFGVINPAFRDGSYLDK